MRLYNTLTRQLDDFTPADPQRVKIYTCGPTVYSHAHIGNFTAYIYWDLLIRTLRLNGWQEDRVLNITDVGHLSSDADDGEDKLEKGARREDKTVWEVARYYEDDFLANFRALNLLEPTQITRATDFIGADIALVDALTEKGYTYETSDGIYYDTAKFPQYADFAHLDLEHLKAGARVEHNPEKHNPSDFALWKWVRDGEDHAMQWDYRGHAGYPGWHIECSAIIHQVLGETIDIHTGGIDHIPVHHTNEIAQSEAAYDQPLSRFWLHNNFITIDGQKISKSLGNVYTFADLTAKGFTHLDYRMWVLQGHFQTERNFSFENLAASQTYLLRLKNFASLRHQKFTADISDEFRVENEKHTKDRIIEALSDNLNTPLAISQLELSISTDFSDPAFDRSPIHPSENLINFLDAAFGLDLLATTPDITAEQKQLIADRNAAKSAKDYAKSDTLRDQLLEQGITLQDSPSGTIWRRTR